MSKSLTHIPRILVIGSSNTDLVIASRRLPKPGETILGGKFYCFPGGKGSNQAVAASRAGAKVSFIGARGDDDFGRRALALLKREKIMVKNFHIRKGSSSGIALILVGGSSRENMISVASSANDQVSVKDILAAQSCFQKSHAVIAQLEIPLEVVLAAAEASNAAHVPFILNPAPAQKLPRTLWKLIHTITPNEREALQLTGELDLGRAGKALLKFGCQRVVITMGSRGALLCEKGRCQRVRCPRVKAVDTVGAGDCFTAWLGVGIAEGLTFEVAVRRALHAASISVTRPGGQSSMPYRHEIRLRAGC